MKTNFTHFTNQLSVAVVMLLFGFSTISCSKDDDAAIPSEPIPVSDIFAVGQNNASPSQEFFYKNNVKTMLSVASNESAAPRAMFVDGDDVYIAGHVYVYPEGGDSYFQPCYWKNNVKVDLPFNTAIFGYADAEAITVVDGDVYVTGVLSESFGGGGIVLWKNGVLNYITGYSDTFTYRPYDICVYNNDIYISGLAHNGTSIFAKYWKNGIETSLSSNPSVSPSIVANQTGVHVLFAEYSGCCAITALKYSKDGVVKTISTQQPEFGKMTVKGNDVYITGSERETGSTVNKACYWKNGVKTELPGGNTLVATDVKVGANGDVFVASRLSGGGYSVLTYWKNNVPATLGSSSDNFSAFDINNK